MADNFVLYNSSYWLPLDTSATVQNLAFGSRVGTPEYNRVFSKPWGRGFSPLVGVNVLNRTAKFLIHQTGTSLDNWVTNSRQMHQVLSDAELYYSSEGVMGDRATLSVKLNGETNTVEYDVIAGQYDDDNIFTPYMIASSPYAVNVPLTLWLKPFGRPQALAQTVSGTLTNGVSTYSLAAIGGDREAPIRLALKDITGGGSRRVVVARRTRGSTANFIWGLECETGTFTGYVTASAVVNFTIANTVSASQHGGNYLKVTNNSAGTIPLQAVIKWTINAHLEDWYGRYRVFLKFANDTANLTGVTVAISYGGTNGTLVQNAAVSFTGADNVVVDLGIIEIPYLRQPPNVTLPSAVMQLLASTTDTTVGHHFGVDCIFLMPVDEQYMDISPGTVAANASINNDNLLQYPQIYIQDSTGDLVTSATPTITADTRFTVKPDVPNLFLALMTSSNNMVLTETYTMTFSYYTLWDLLR